MGKKQRDKRIEYNGFYIDRTKTGHRICRIEDNSIHSHIKNLNTCYKLIDNVNEKKLPKKYGLYMIESHIRLSIDKEYTRKLEDYLKIRTEKTKNKQFYYNPNKGTR